MTKKMKILIVSCISIMCCAVLITVGVIALFSDSAKVTNHLQAGRLDITLTRTKLVSTLLNQETGFLEDKTDSTTVDFTAPTDDNIFGVTEGKYVVPGTKFTATMRIAHASGSNVAFAYWIEVKLDTAKLTEDQYKALAEQLTLTVKDLSDGGVTQSMALSKGLTLGSQISPIATVALGEHGDFEVALTFGDSVNNNAAQDQQIYFDLIVHAVQVTKAN